jgi:hypothetical protein
MVFFGGSFCDFPETFVMIGYITSNGGVFGFHGGERVGSGYPRERRIRLCLFFSHEASLIYALYISMQQSQNIHEGCGDTDTICILSRIIGITDSNEGKA